MTRLYDFPRPILGPDALRIAADAFEAALQSFHEGVCEIEPHKARQLLARHIIVEAQRGQRDPQRLRDAALKHLETSFAPDDDGLIGR
jgi:hypothetical protein